MNHVVWPQERELGVAAPQPIKNWTERMLEHALLIDEVRTLRLLQIPDAMPLRSDGGSTSNATDLVFIDPNGRLTLVELKSVEATPVALAQLLAYGQHYRVLPWGELERGFAEMEHAKAQRTAEASETVRILANGDAAKVAPRQPITTPRYIDAQPRGIQEAARARWGHEVPKRASIPPRLVLAAPSFDPVVEQMADELRRRGVDIRLATCALMHIDGNLVLHWRWREVKPYGTAKGAPEHGPTFGWSDMLCDALACFEEDAMLSERVVSNGWTEQLQTWLVSASLRKHWPVKLYLDAHEGESDQVSLWTSLPHGWCESKTERASWRKELDAALSRIGGTQEGDAWYWLFDWPKQRKQFAIKALEVATVLEEVVTRSL